MSGMSEYLANYFGTKTASAQTEEEQEAAQVEFFAKVAAENNIDLSTLSEAQIQGLWDGVFKGASEGEEDKGEDDKKKEEAKKELEEKKAAAEKFAEAEYMGKIMAHSYVAELNKIAAGATEIGAKARDFASRAGSGLKRIATGAQFREGHDMHKLVNSSEGKKMLAQDALKHAPQGARDAHMVAKGKELAEGAKKDMLHGAAKTVGLYGGGAAAVGGGAALAAHSRKKQSSALDQLGAEGAVKMAMAAGFDGNEAAERVSAVLTLGLGESEKIAASALHLTDDQAIEIRSLEFLEAAGYPVTWNS